MQTALPVQIRECRTAAMIPSVRYAQTKMYKSGLYMSERWRILQGQKDVAFHSV